MLTLGQLGPWGGQGFVPGGITILRPETMQWETILATPGDADLMTSTLSEEVEPGSTLEYAQGSELYPPFGFGVPGLPINVGIPTDVGGSVGGHLMLSVVPASQYTWQHFSTTTLGEVRHTIGLSNGATGPLSPIVIGKQNAVDRDGNRWLPVVRIANDNNRSGGGGSW